MPASSLTIHPPRFGLLFDSKLSGALTQLWATLGSPAFIPAVLDVLDAVCPIDSGGTLVYYRQQRPLSLLHRFNPTERQVPADIYSTGPYALDPQYRAFLNGCASGAYWLRDIAPDDFYSSEYYLTFYSKTGVADSIDVIWRIDDDTAINFFLQRNINSNEFSSGDLAALTLVTPIVFAALGQHQQLQTVPRSKAVDTTHLQVECTLTNFASSLLTPRERDVLMYLLRGYSSALTAQRLNTSEGTIKIHRKNIYRKLDIGSQAELFSLFINCIPFAKPDEQSDPLQVYQQSQRGTRALV